MCVCMHACMSVSVCNRNRLLGRGEGNGEAVKDMKL